MKRGKLKVFTGMWLVVSLVAALFVGIQMARATCGFTCWEVIPSYDPNTIPVDTSTSHLYSVAAGAQDDAWAVGDYIFPPGSPSVPLAKHWDGTVWSTISPASATTLDHTLFGVATLAANDVWAVGMYTIPPTGWRTLTYHWNGAGWTKIDSPNILTGDNKLFAVAPIPNSSGKLWAVGIAQMYHDLAPAETLVLKWEAPGWTVVPSPSIEGAPISNALNSVAALSDNDAWAVGSYNDMRTQLSQPLILHWNGTSWDLIPNPSNTPDNCILTSVSAVSAGDVWAVGSYDAHIGTRKTLTMHWNGTTQAWSIQPSPNVGSGTNALQGVSFAASGAGWAMGYYKDSNGTPRTLGEVWDGTSWSIQSTPNVDAMPGMTTNDNELEEISVTPGASPNGGYIWAAGSYYDGSGLSRTLIERYTLPSLVGRPR